jgi:hypothetical protein
MEFCARCGNGRWVCENHPERPFLGDRACTCGGAGAPCPSCNQTDPDDLNDLPDMPEGFVVDKVFTKSLSVQSPEHQQLSSVAQSYPQVQRFLAEGSYRTLSEL